MISKKVGIAPKNDRYGKLAAYIADAGPNGEKNLMSWSAGCLGDDDYQRGIAEVLDVQAMNTRTRLSKTYHLVISFRPEDEGKLNPEVFKTIETRFAVALGYEEHQRHCGVHKNTGNLHMHIAYNMIHPEKHTWHKEFRDFRIRDALCRELEQEFGLAVKDAHTKAAMKASALDRSLSLKKLESRLGLFARAQNMEVVQEHSRYRAEPLHRSPERGQLFAAFQKAIETRKEKLQTIKEQEASTLAAIRLQWEAKRQEIERMNIAKRNRRNLLALARKHEDEALAKARLAMQPEREGVRQEIPFSSWSGFLQHQAGQGNEIALAVLRSRQEAAQPEQAQEPARQITSPVKDRSTHGLDYATVKADFATQQRSALENPALSGKGKTRLLAVLRMEQIAVEQGLQITHRVDGKGTVVFTLGNGGSIRDTGKEVLFSAHDKAAQAVAICYAQKKWGKAARLEGNVLRREVALEQSPELKQLQDKEPEKRRGRER